VKAAKLDFSEGQHLIQTVAGIHRWMRDAEHALSQSPDLRRLQALLDEAQRLPVDLSQTCEVIRGKVEQAQKWVEKVRGQEGSRLNG
jgi:hypothetical protein